MRMIALAAGSALTVGLFASSSAASAAAVRPVEVRVYALPASSTYPHVDGAQVPMTLVAETTTANRTFSVSLHALPAKITNLVAIGPSGAVIVDEYFFSASRAGRYTRTFPALSHVSSASVDHAPAHPGVPGVVECTTHFVRSLGNPWGVVGGTYSSTSISGTDHFSYRSGSSSSVGVGESATGKAGSFSASGTNSVSTDAVTSYPEENFSAGGHRYRTEFAESEYDIICINTLTGSESHNYYNQAESWYGGAEVVKAGNINTPDCAPYTAKTFFTADTTNAWTFDDGISIPYIGFTASMQTGYTTTAEVNYLFGANGQLCGIDSGPGGSDPLLLQAES
ncbi:MAG TPA: hypothetical protein VGH27_13905 [Streptosporangiaceae bacterium]|jgi:hypothetical protein